MRNTRLGPMIKIKSAAVPTAGAATGITFTEVDCTGYDRALYVLHTGAAGTGATLAFKVEEAAATGMGTPADITSAASAGLTAAANASKIHTYDIPVNPAKPFQMGVGTIGTQTLANSCLCILYKAARYPVDTAYATEAIVV